MRLTPHRQNRRDYLRESAAGALRGEGFGTLPDAGAELTTSSGTFPHTCAGETVDRY